MKNTNKSIMSNFIWRFMERWGAQAVTLIVSIILARILEPKVYGVIALVMVLINLFQVFIDSGLGTALIQKKNADELDFSTVFWFNLTMCIVLYIIIYFCAPAIAAFYNMSELVTVIRVLSLTLVISGVKGIQQSYVARNMLFKRFFFATLGGTVGAAIVGVIMAYEGFGVWALVAQYLFNNFIDTLILWFTVGWKPSMSFSFKRFKALFEFGWKMLVSTIIDTLYNNMRSLIIGKYYTSEDLAYYNKGKQFPEMAVTNINSAMNSVLLPAMAKKQDDLIEVKAMTKRVIQTSTFIICPLMVGLCVVADGFVRILLTSKWVPCVLFLRIICLEQALQPLQTTNLSVVKALGKADYHLKMEVIKKTIAFLLVVVGSFFGVKAIAMSSVVYAIIASFINAYPNKQLIDYSYLEQLKDVTPSIICSVIMGIIVGFVGLLFDGYIIRFVVQVITGVIVYVILCVVSKNESYRYIFNLINTSLKR